MNTTPFTLGQAMPLLGIQGFLIYPHLLGSWRDIHRGSISSKIFL